MSSTSISVIIADAQTLTRNGLAKTLEPTKEIEIMAITGCISELTLLCNRHQPDVIIMSAAMPCVDNMKPYRYITDQFPHVPVIVLADDNDAETIVAMNTSGEFAWLYKSATEEKIVATILAVHKGTYKNELYNGYGTSAVNRALLDALTPREKEMLTYFGADLTAKEIAAIQNLSIRTIEGHKEKIKEKLRVKGSGLLAIYALLQNTYLPTLLYWTMLLFTNGNPDTILADITA
ncbi:response regulator transcription factor [Ginsengibacter hankyongi]|uniref:Response regulator transcription factor n=1 Tax=Ginsengibacter hankyongi TaxID=2607284 RepID=A0A5J5IAV8_9BACT|nr:response regulator transcription factor [Ginsengibacter hankyongi]KAA9034560.1 response regulator transcription factor [Ginsengibacter hankyongi]